MYSSPEVLLTEESLVEGLDSWRSLPEDLLFNIPKLAGESQLALASKTMHSLFQPANQVLNKFLECVAFGKQDKAEELFTGIYSAD